MINSFAVYLRSFYCEPKHELCSQANYLEHLIKDLIFKGVETKLGSLVHASDTQK